TPPGLTMVSVSPRAWEAAGQAKLPRFYFDYRQMKSWTDKGETPYTPAIPLLRGLREALRTILAEGIPATIARHQQLGAAVRAGNPGGAGERAAPLRDEAGARRRRRRRGNGVRTVNRPRILVAEPVAAEGIALLERGAQVEATAPLSEADLCARVGEFDALVV